MAVTATVLGSSAKDLALDAEVFEADVKPNKSSKQQTDVAIEQLVLDVLRPYGFDSIVADSKAHVDAITGRPIGGHAAPPNLTELTIKEASAHPGERPDRTLRWRYPVSTCPAGIY